MVFADFFANRDDNSLPSHHRSQPECHGDCDLDPSGDETSRAVNVGLVVLKHGRVGGRNLHLAARLDQTQCFTHDIHIVAKIAHAIIRNLGEFLKERHLGADVVDQFAHGQLVLGVKSRVRM